MPVSDRDSSLYVWIDQDLGAIRQIAPKMYYVHSLLSVSCFAEFCEKWTVIVREMLINLLKWPIMQ